MAFICPPKEDTQRLRNVVGQLKDVANKIVDDQENVPCLAPCPPCCPRCCAPCPAPCPPQASDSKPCKLPDVMVCYKIKKPTKSDNADAKKSKEDQNKEQSKVKPSKSRELRASILYSGCDCEKLNGLQDDCQRSQCRGSPECLTKPKPTCGPNEFSNGKHMSKKFNRGGDAGNGENAGGVSGGIKEDAGDEYQCFPAVIKFSC